MSLKVHICTTHIKTVTRVLLKRYYSSSSPKAFNQIPGPFRIPLLGNLYHYKLGKYKIKKYHNVLEDLYKEYGPIVREQIGSRTVVHVFDPDDIRTVYSNEGIMPHVAPLMETTQFYRKQKKTSLGLGNVNGEEWFRLRSAVRQMMLRPQEVHVYLPVVQAVASDFVSRIEKKRDAEGRVENLRDEISKWVQESAGMICFEKRLGCLSGDSRETEAQRIIDANKEIFHLSGILKFSLPLYKYLPSPKWKKILKAEDLVYRFVEKHVGQTICEVKDNNSLTKYNFMSYLLSKDSLSQNDIFIISFSLFMDGLSTTVPALMYNLYCLATNEDVQEKAYNEIASVVKEDEAISVNVLNRLSYLKAVVKETFRLFPIGTEVSRITQQDLVLSGYQVPSGTQVDLTPNVHFQSEKYFKHAKKYTPERWLRQNESSGVDPYLLTPFGHGVRTCAGRRFAEQDLYIALSLILKRFKLEYHQSSKPLEQVFDSLLFPEGKVDVIFKNRNS